VSRNGDSTHSLKLHGTSFLYEICLLVSSSISTLCFNALFTPLSLTLKFTKQSEIFTTKESTKTQSVITKGKARYNNGLGFLKEDTFSSHLCVCVYIYIYIYIYGNLLALM
jgi:hypothetical protein